jgi:hypothetical protein
MTLMQTNYEIWAREKCCFNAIVKKQDACFPPTLNGGLCQFKYVFKSFPKPMRCRILVQLTSLPFLTGRQTNQRLHSHGAQRGAASRHHSGGWVPPEYGPQLLEEGPSELLGRPIRFTSQASQAVDRYLFRNLSLTWKYIVLLDDVFIFWAGTGRTRLISCIKIRRQAGSKSERITH